MCLSRGFCLRGAALSEEQARAVEESMRLAVSTGFVFNCAKAGKGKTYMALGLAMRWWQRLEQGGEPLRPIVVAMPLAVFEQNAAVFERHAAEGVRVFGYHSQLPERHRRLEEAMARPGPLLILATHSVIKADHHATLGASPLFEGLGDEAPPADPKGLAPLYQRGPGVFSGLLVDESHEGRNGATALSQALRRLAAQVHPAHGFTGCFSGTPAVNKGAADVLPQMLLGRRLVLEHGREMQDPSKRAFRDLFRSTSLVLRARPNEGGYPDLKVTVRATEAPSGMAREALQRLLGEARSLVRAGDQTPNLNAVLTKMRLLFASGAAAEAGYPAAAAAASRCCALCRLPRKVEELEEEEEEEEEDDGLRRRRKKVLRPMAATCGCGHGRCSACHAADAGCCQACSHLEAVRIENLGRRVPEEYGAPHWNRSAYYTEKHAFLAHRLRCLVASAGGRGGLPDKALLVFSHVTSSECFRQFLRDVGLGHLLEACVAIDGTVPRKDRVEAQALLNAPDARRVACLLTAKAGGVGLNLQGANEVIFVDAAWNCAVVEQAICRAWRLRQTRDVAVTYLVARNGPGLPSLEEAMMDLCRRKESEGEDLLHGGQVTPADARREVAGSIVKGSVSFLRREDGSQCRIRRGTFFQPVAIRVVPSVQRAVPPPPRHFSVVPKPATKPPPPVRPVIGKLGRFKAKLEARRRRHRIKL